MTDINHSQSVYLLIIKTLVSASALSISDISARLGISVPTTTKYLDSLSQAGLVVRRGKTDTGHGRKPGLYAINEKAGYFVGVDIKNRSVQIALMNLAGSIVLEKEYPVEFSNTPETMETVCEWIDSFISSCGVPPGSVGTVAVNLSGRVNPMTGYSYSVFNFEQHDEPLAVLLSERLGRRTIIENDTRAMAFGELNTVVGGKYRNFIFINASWGIGLSIIIDGRVYYGMNGYSGEFGHTYVYDNEQMCHCGKKGCLETVVSGRAICAQLQERLAAGETSILSGRKERGEIITEKEIIDAANHDDPLSMELIEKTGSELGRQIANLINIFNPEAVIIGGSLSHAGDLFLQPVQMAVRRYSLKLIFKGVDIICSSLGERAGVIGACLKAREEYLDHIV